MGVVHVSGVLQKAVLGAAKQNQVAASAIHTSTCFAHGLHFDNHYREAFPHRLLAKQCVGLSDT